MSASTEDERTLVVSYRHFTYADHHLSIHLSSLLFRFLQVEYIYIYIFESLSLDLLFELRVFAIYRSDLLANTHYIYIYICLFVSVIFDEKPEKTPRRVVSSRLVPCYTVTVW